MTNKSKYVDLTNFKYNLLNQGYLYSWSEIEEWMVFFILLGKYVQSSKKISVYVNYMDDKIPAVLLTFGAIWQKFEEIRQNRIPLWKEMLNSLSEGDKVTYFDGRNWNEAEVKGLEYNGNPEFDPYLVVEITKRGNKKGTYSIPKTLLGNRIRVNANYKKTTGSGVKLNEDFSPALQSLFGTKTCKKIIQIGDPLVYLIGRGIQKDIIQTRNIFCLVLDGTSNREKRSDTFIGEKASPNGDLSIQSLRLSLRDVLVIEDDVKSYQNINFIKSEMPDVENLISESIRMFVGANNANAFSWALGDRNVILSNRKRGSQKEDQILVTRLLQERNDNDASEKEKEFRQYLESSNIRIPKGLEYYFIN